MNDLGEEQDRPMPQGENWNRVNTGVPYFVVLHFIARPRCCIFFFSFFLQTEGKTPTSKKTTGFFGILALLWCSETQPAVSLRYACVFDE